MQCNLTLTPIKLWVFSPYVHKKNTLKSLSRRKEIALIVGWRGWGVETNLCICIFFSPNYSGGVQGGPTMPWHPQYFNCTWNFYRNSKSCVINLS